MSSAAKKTGAYNPSFWYAETGIFPEIQIDGLPAATINVGAQTSLTAGSVYYDLNSGIVHCHEDDYGKTLSAKYTAVYYPSPKTY